MENSILSSDNVININSKRKGEQDFATFLKEYAEQSNSDRGICILLSEDGNINMSQSGDITVSELLMYSEILRGLALDTMYGE